MGEYPDEAVHIRRELIPTTVPHSGTGELQENGTHQLLTEIPSCEAERMVAPTNAALVNKALANSEPSTQDPKATYADIPRSRIRADKRHRTTGRERRRARFRPAAHAMRGSTLCVQRATPPGAPGADGHEISAICYFAVANQSQVSFCFASILRCALKRLRPRYASFYSRSDGGMVVTRPADIRAETACRQNIRLRIFEGGVL